MNGLEELLEHRRFMQQATAAQKEARDAFFEFRTNTGLSTQTGGFSVSVDFMAEELRFTFGIGGQELEIGTDSACALRDWLVAFLGPAEVEEQSDEG